MRRSIVSHITTPLSLSVFWLKGCQINHNSNVSAFDIYSKTDYNSIFTARSRFPAIVRWIQIWPLPSSRLGLRRDLWRQICIQRGNASMDKQGRKGRVSKALRSLSRCKHLMFIRLNVYIITYSRVWLVCCIYLRARLIWNLRNNNKTAKLDISVPVVF